MFLSKWKKKNYRGEIITQCGPVLVAKYSNLCLSCLKGPHEKNDKGRKTAGVGKDYMCQKHDKAAAAAVKKPLHFPLISTKITNK